MKKIVFAEIFCFVVFCLITIMISAGAIDPNLGVKNPHSIPVHIDGPDAPSEQAPSAPTKPMAAEEPVHFIGGENPPAIPKKSESAEFKKETPAAKKLVVGESTSGKIPTLNRSEEHGPVVVKSDNEDFMFHSSEHGLKTRREVHVKENP